MHHTSIQMLLQYLHRMSTLAHCIISLPIPRNGSLPRKSKEVTRIVRTTALDNSDALNIAARPSQRTPFYVSQSKPLVPGEGYHVGMSTKIHVKRMGGQLEVSIERVVYRLDRAAVTVSIHCTSFRGLKTGRHHVTNIVRVKLKITLAQATKAHRGSTVISRLTKIIRSGITFVSRNVISRRFL